VPNTAKGNDVELDDAYDLDIVSSHDLDPEYVLKCRNVVVTANGNDVA